MRGSKFFPFLLVAVITLLTVDLEALSPGTAGPAFLRIGVGARPSGMGEAFTAGSDDVSSITWNPAGLGLVYFPQATFMHLSFIGDTNYDSLSYAHPLGVGTLGGSIMYLQVPEFDNTYGRELPVTSGQYALMVSYGGKLGYLYPVGSDLDNLLLGTSVKWVGLSISGVSSFQYIAVDLGTSYKTSVKGMNVGLSLLNLGTSVNQPLISNALPFALRFGFAYEWDSGLDVADLIYYLDNSVYLHLGAEWWWQKTLALRAGYKVGGPGLGSLKGLTLGGGWQYSSFRVDYAFVPYGDLGITHRISGTVAFGALEVGSARLGGVEDLLKQAKRYYDDGFLEQAVKLWKKALEIKPNLSRVKEWIANVESELKDETKNNEIYEYLLAGDRLYNEGKYVEAIQEWKKAREMNPKLTSVDRRINKAEEMIGQSSKDVGGHIQNAQTALSQEDYAKALQEWRTVQAVQPGNAQAEQGIKTVIERRSSRVKSLHAEAETYSKRGDVYNSAKRWRRIQKMDSEDKTAQDRLKENMEKIEEEAKYMSREANTEYLNGEYKQAIRIWEKALEILPDDERIKAQIKDARDRIVK